MGKNHYYIWLKHQGLVSSVQPNTTAIVVQQDHLNCFWNSRVLLPDLSRLCMQQSQQRHMRAFALLDLLFGHTIRQTYCYRACYDSFSAYKKTKQNKPLKYWMFGLHAIRGLRRRLSCGIQKRLEQADQYVILFTPLSWPATIENCKQVWHSQNPEGEISCFSTTTWTK